MYKNLLLLLALIVFGLSTGCCISPPHAYMYGPGQAYSPYMGGGMASGSGCCSPY